MTTEKKPAAPVRWEIPWPDLDRPAAGYPILEGVEHFDVFLTTTELGVYDHPPRILHGGGTFFIWSSFVKPHFPCELPSDWPCPYRPEDIPLRASYRPEGWPPDEKFTFMSNMQQSYRRTGWLEEASLREFAAYYYGNVTLIDVQIGRILARLEELGLRENTLVIFSADHGEGLGERDILGKATFYDESARVPMIASGPMVPAPGTVDERPVMLEDLCPTFLEAGGAAVEGLIGESLLPLLREPGRPGREAIFGILGGSFHFEPGEAHCFVRAGDWKYMYQFARGTEKLYNLREDPVELVDRADDPGCAGVRDELHRRLADWFDRCGAGFLTKRGRLRKDLRQ